MALQLGLSFGNGPFIVHKVAGVHRRVLDHNRSSSGDLCAMNFAPSAKFSQTGS